jgi:hypothetical protein
VVREPSVWVDRNRPATQAGLGEQFSTAVNALRRSECSVL